MADRYWVGGTASWDGNATNKWSATPGGPGGASVPTSADDVYFQGSLTSGGSDSTTIWIGDKFVIGGRFGNVYTSTTGLSAASWTRRASAVFNFIRGFSWNGSIVVAVGGAGDIQTSPDGITWTARTSGTTNDLNSVTWNGSIFVAVGNSGTIRTSSDGITWTNQTSGTANTLRGVAWGGSNFTAVGDNGTVITSSNGTTWTTQTSGTTRTLFSVIYTGSSFIAVGGSGVIRSSPDGVSWTLQTSGTTNDLYSISASSTLLVANGAGGTILTSTDGIAWITRSSGTTEALAGNATWNGSIFLIVYSALLGGVQNVLISTTGDTWITYAGSITVTIASGNTGAKSINCIGFSGTLAGTAAISVAGDVTYSASMASSYSGTLTITGTGTITSAGKSFGAVTINGAGITVTLGDALTSSGTLTVTQGTFTTNNFNVTVGFLLANNSNVKTFNLGSSVVTITSNGVVFSVAITNTTFNAGTSTIILSGGPSTTLQVTGLGGLTFNNVSFTNTALTTATIQGLNTFNNLSIASPATAGVTQVSISGNQSINGTLSTSGTAGNRRVWFRSDTYGVCRTLTVNSAPSLTDADFRDIIVNGTAAPISGTRIGNRGACTGITFSAPKTVYWNLSGASVNWTDNAWAASSGGSVSTDNFPLPQDTAVINNTNPGNGSAINLTNFGYIPTLDMSARTVALTIGLFATTIYGSWTNGSGITLSGNPTLTFEGQGTKTITSAGKTFSNPITIDAYGGTVELADAFISNNSFTVTNGNFNTKNFSFTTGNFSSSNTNFRKINFGSSAIAVRSFDLANTVGLDFNAGTSTITSGFPFNGPTNWSGGGLTYYNVVFVPDHSGGTKTISGTNTYNNLTIDYGSLNIINYSFADNQIINGAFTLNATRGVLLSSTVVGTRRTLTCASINSITGGNFRDIEIAGAAAGFSVSSQQVGNMGNNAGLVFPSPKTVYRVTTNSTSYDGPYWALTSGGTATSNTPLPQDTAIIDNNTLATSLDLGFSAYYFYPAIDTSNRTTAFTLSYGGGNAKTQYGGLKISPSTTISNVPSLTFINNHDISIDLAGVTFPGNIAFDGTGSVQLSSAFTSSSTITFIRGTFDAVTYNVTCRDFLSSNSNTRTLNMGSGLWTLTGTGTVWDLTGTTNLTFFKGAADILLSDNSTTARGFNGGSLSYNKLTIGGTTGTSTTTISQTNTFAELASTKTVAHTIAFGSTNQTFGKWSVTGSAGNLVTLSGTGTSHSIIGSATSGIDYLVMGTLGFGSSSTGEFYAGPNSTGTAASATFRSAPPTPRTLYWVGGTGNWSDTTKWSLTSGGVGGQAVPTSLDNVIFNSASSATAYTCTIDGVSRCNSLTITGPASGNMTLAGSSSLYCHGNITLPSAGLTRTFNGDITLTGSTAGKIITTNGVSLPNIFVNGIGCGWTLGDALTSTGELSVRAGTINTANYALNAGILSSLTRNSRSIILGSSTVVLSSNASVISFDNINLNFNSGTSNIILSNVNPAIVSFNQTFFNVSFTNTALTTPSIRGNNVFNNITISGRASAGVSQFRFFDNQTVNGTLTFSPGTSAVCRTFVYGENFGTSIIGTVRNITCNSVLATDVDFRDIVISGLAAPVIGTRLGDCGGNSGITFPAPKTVFWNITGALYGWDTNAWATTPNGTPSLNNFPLPQDTAAFTDSGTLGQINIASIGYNFPTIDMSARTTSMTMNVGLDITVYGSWINGPGVIISGAGVVNFSGRGVNTLTTSGKTITFPVTINAPGGTLQLGDATVISNSITLSRGNFNANNYTLVATAFSSNNSNVRSITMGNGPWFLSGVGVVWELSTITNLTFNKDTSEIQLTSTSTTGRSFNGGGLSYNRLVIGGANAISTLTINGNNQFTEISSTKTVAHTIVLGTTTQRIGAFNVNGSIGNIVTITGNTSNMIYSGSSRIVGLDYLNLQGRVFGSSSEITDVWYAGQNSINSGTLGWVFSSYAPPLIFQDDFFLMFA